MKKHIGKIVLTLVLVCLVAVGILYGNNFFGIRGVKIESDIGRRRKSRRTGLWTELYPIP